MRARSGPTDSGAVTVIVECNDTNNGVVQELRPGTKDDYHGDRFRAD